MKHNKLPISLLGTGAALTYATYNAHNSSKATAEIQRQAAEHHQEVLRQQAQNHQEQLKVINDVKTELQDCKVKVDKLEAKIEDINSNQSSSNVTPGSSSNQGNNFIENNDYIPSLDDIQSYFSIVQDYFNSIPFEKVLALVHIYLLLCLIYLLFNGAMIYYSNYLLSNFKIFERYPKLVKILEYRNRLQKYLILYNIFIALFLIVMYLFLDLYVFFN